MCTIRGSIFACTIEKPTGKLKFGYTVELKLWNSKKKVNFPTFDCSSKQKISEKPNRLISNIEGCKDSPAKVGIASNIYQSQAHSGMEASKRDFTLANVNDIIPDIIWTTIIQER